MTQEERKTQAIEWMRRNFQKEIDAGKLEGLAYQLALMVEDTMRTKALFVLRLIQTELEESLRKVKGLIEANEPQEGTGGEG